MNKIELPSGVEYYPSLPEGYIKMTDILEIFQSLSEDEVLTTDNAKIRTGIELIVFNPQTNQYYSRYLTYSSNRQNLLRYMNDGNLYIHSKDIILNESKQIK